MSTGSSASRSGARGVYRSTALGSGMSNAAAMPSATASPDIVGTSRRPPSGPARTTRWPSATRRVDEGLVRGQQVDPVARREAVEVDPGRGAQAQHHRLGRQRLRAEGLLALDGPLARRHAALPARGAQLVPPAAGGRRGTRVRGGERVRRGARAQVGRVVPVLAVVARLVVAAAREVGDLVRGVARVRQEAVRAARRGRPALPRASRRAGPASRATPKRVRGWIVSW